MVEHQAKTGIALGDAVGQVHVLMMEKHHGRDTNHLHLAPQPVEAAVEQRLAQDFSVEGEAHAEHALLLLQPTIRSRAPGHRDRTGP